MAPKFMESDVAEIEDVLLGQATKANEAKKLIWLIRLIRCMFTMLDKVQDSPSSC